MAGDEEGGPSASRSISLPTPPTPAPVTTSTSAPVRPPTLQLKKSSTAANASASANPTGSRLVRRVTTQERLDNILQLGRRRAESMSPGRSPPNFRNASFRTAGSGTPPAQAEVFYERVEDRANQEVPDPEPDEMTGIVMKGPSLSTPSAMNYQSTATTESSVARTRKNGSAATMPRSNTGRRREGAGASGTASGNGNGCDDANGNGYASNKEAAAWWKTQLAKFGSIELENKGSVARDHLALERTFLAWLRTSLSFASIGVAITQLFRLNTSLSTDESASQKANAHTLRHLGKPLGAIFLSISILMLFLGYSRYFQAQQWIIKGKFPASRGTVILVSLVALCLMVISLVVVLLVPATSSG